MPEVKSIIKTMSEKGIPVRIMAQINYSDKQENEPKEVLALINQMDNLLTQEERLSIMEEQGCYKTGEAHEMNLLFGRTHADKSVEERIPLLNDKVVHPNVPCHVNDDGTLSIFWEIGKEGNYQCACSFYAQLKKEQPHTGNISKTYCGCCGGHIRHHYQNILGVKLRLKEIVSSPISSNGEKRCEFLFEILNQE
jgi:hypothetical protein